jgi:ATP-dependent RNA helicase
MVESKSAQKKVDPQIVDEEMVIESSEKLELVESFDALNLNEQLLRGLYAYGFNKPSAVQKRAILPIIRKRDVIV